MQEDKHSEALKESIATIKAALDDKEGLLPHQRRLMSMLSMGCAHLVEIHLHRIGVIKPGAQIKHEWFLLGEPRVKDRLEPSITKKTADIPGIERIITLARKIENGRNDIVYGAPLKDDRLLREKIDEFLDLKQEVEKLTGEPI